MIYDDFESDEQATEVATWACFVIWTLACVGFGVLVGIVILRGWQ